MKLPNPDLRTKTHSRLVPHWRRLWRAWSVQLAALGVFLPELLQLIADNTNGLDWLGGGTKNAIRLACLIGVVLLRPVKQETLT
jgi:hypothetical protein